MSFNKRKQSVELLEEWWDMMFNSGNSYAASGLEMERVDTLEAVR
jgi:hypothetical protein